MYARYKIANFFVLIAFSMRDTACCYERYGLSLPEKRRIAKTYETLKINPPFSLSELNIIVTLQKNGYKCS